MLLSQFFIFFNKILIQKNKTLRYNIVTTTKKEKRDLMYKNYNMNQITLPLETEVLIPDDDISKAVHTLVESMPEDIFDGFRQSQGASSYHPKMMLKILFCAYSQSVFSGRKIEALLQDSIRMMWLAQNQIPSYRTINRFRAHPKMAALLQSAFIQFRYQLESHDLIESDAIFIDGTKIEANANKYTFVFRKNIDRHESALLEKSKEKYDALVASEVIPEMIRESDGPLTASELAHIHTQLTESEANLTAQIESAEDMPARKAIRTERSGIRKSKKAMKDYLDRRLNYQTQRSLMGERNSYSKTDHDATFMRMKDDHMQNGQLKSGYNLQIATNNQFVLGYDIYWNPTDTRTLDPFLHTMQHTFQYLPEYIVADAGYGSESNYEGVADKYERQALIPYNTYYKEQKKNYRTNEMHPNHWEYNAIDDYYVCPNNRRLPLNSHTVRTDKYGYHRVFKIYECEDCQDCPLMKLCKKSAPDRPKQIQKNMNLEYFKAQMNQTLSSPEGRRRYAQRKIDVETTFGNLKANLGFTRMSVRGNNQVRNELGIALMAVNLRKLVRQSVFTLLKSTKNGLEILKSRFPSHFSYFFRAFVPAPLVCFICYLCCLR